MSLKWSDSKLKQWSAKVEWEFIPSPKGEVDQGLGHLKNRIKQPCLGKVDSLSYVIKGHIVWSMAFPMDSSRNIVKARPLGQPLIRLVVGVVQSNLLWFDKWHPLDSLHFQLNNCLVLPTEISQFEEQLRKLSKNASAK